MPNWPEKDGPRHSPGPGQHPGREHGSEDHSEAGSPGQDAGQVPRSEAEESQRITDLIRTLHSGVRSVLGIKEPPSNEEIEESPEENGRLGRVRYDIERRRARLFHKDYVDLSPGEKRGSEIENVQAIPLEEIVVDDDKEFKNTRLYDEAFRPGAQNSEGQKLDDLKKSMLNDGQKTPIVVIEGADRKFHLRAGFRRHKCAVALKWTALRAIILPPSLNKQEEYWFNILENTTRKALNTYEIASAALMMQNEFGITPREFSDKTGYSYAYVIRLLACINNLPEELTDQWKRGCGLSFDQWCQLAKLDPHNAIAYFRRWMGLPSQTQIERVRRAKEKEKKLAPVKWLDRMQRLYEGLEGANAPFIERMNYLRIVEYCMGSRDNVPGIYEPKKHKDYIDRHVRRQQYGLDDIPVPTEMKDEDDVPHLEYDGE